MGWVADGRAYVSLLPFFSSSVDENEEEFYAEEDASVAYEGQSEAEEVMGEEEAQ